MKDMFLKKDQTDACIYKQFFVDIPDKYGDYIPIYTDRTRDRNDVATVIFFPSNCISMRLLDTASVFSAEVLAIIKALDEIETLDTSNILFIMTHFHISKLYTI